MTYNSHWNQLQRRERRRFGKRTACGTRASPAEKDRRFLPKERRRRYRFHAPPTPPRDDRRHRRRSMDRRRVRRGKRKRRAFAGRMACWIERGYGDCDCRRARRSGAEERRRPPVTAAREAWYLRPRAENEVTQPPECWTTRRSILARPGHRETSSNPVRETSRRMVDANCYCCCC